MGNKNSKNSAMQTKNSGSSQSYYDSMRSEAKQAVASLKQGLYKSAIKHGQISQGSNPHTPRDAILQGTRSAWAGRKEFGQAAVHGGKAAYNATGAFMEGIARQHGPSPTVTYEKTRINQAIAQGRKQQNTVSNARANAKQSNTNAQQTDKSTNRGIASYQSKASGQSSSASRSSANGSSKGSNASSGKSGGSSRGGQSR